MTEQTETKKDFFVLVAMRVRAENPEDAVLGFVDTVVERGLRVLTYRVDGDDQVVGYYDGFGHPKENRPTGPTTTVEMPTLSTPVTEVRRVEPDSSEPSGSVDGESDAELAAYASQVQQT